MLLNFDTGSSDFWVYSSLMPSSERGSHAIYNPTSSGGKLKSGYTWDIGYGDGSGAAGKLYADKVVVGAVTVTTMAVGAATSVGSWDSVADGIVGLSFSNINTVKPQPQLTFFDTARRKLKQPIFTADLKKGTAGRYDFGYIDSSKYTGAITYVPVNNGTGFWEFLCTGYHIGSGGAVTYHNTVIVDTGTSLMVLEQGIVDAYWKKVSGATYSSSQGGWIFPCSTTPPKFGLSIGGKVFYVPGSYMNYGAISNTMCFGGMQRNTGLSFGILGDVFMKSQFFIFYGGSQYSMPKLGIANKPL